jgi:hypothetical protein
MAKKLYDLAVKTGEYTVQGPTKGRYENVGAVMQSDDGGKFIMLKRVFNPAGVPDLSGRNSDSILLSMFPPKDGDQAQSQPQQRQAAPQQQATALSSAQSGGYVDDIPF